MGGGERVSCKDRKRWMGERNEENEIKKRNTLRIVRKASWKKKRRRERGIMPVMGGFNPSPLSTRFAAFPTEEEEAKERIPYSVLVQCTCLVFLLEHERR